MATLFQFISIHFSSVTGDVRADSTAQRQKEKNPVEIHGRKKTKKVGTNAQIKHNTKPPKIKIICKEHKQMKPARINQCNTIQKPNKH